MNEAPFPHGEEFGFLVVGDETEWFGTWVWSKALSKVMESNGERTAISECVAELNSLVKYEERTLD